MEGTERPELGGNQPDDRDPQNHIKGTVSSSCNDAGSQTAGRIPWSRIQILTGIEAELLRHLADPDRLKKASINNLAYAFYQINNARRLEEGRSTQNLDMRQVIAQLDSEGARIRQLLERITYHDEKETQ